MHPLFFILLNCCGINFLMFFLSDFWFFSELICTGKQSMEMERKQTMCECNKMCDSRAKKKMNCKIEWTNELRMVRVASEVPLCAKLIFVFSETNENEMSEQANDAVRWNWLLFGSTNAFTIHSRNDEFKCGANDMRIVISSFHFRRRSITRDIMNRNPNPCSTAGPWVRATLSVWPTSGGQFTQLYIFYGFAILFTIVVCVCRL